MLDPHIHSYAVRTVVWMLAWSQSISFLEFRHNFLKCPEVRL